MNAREGCPPRDRLEAFADGAPDAQPHREHIESCERCGRELARIRANNDFLGEIASALGDSAPTIASPHAESVRPLPLAGEATRAGEAPSATLIKGYELLDEIHRGGQGVVYRARQLAAKRLVAVKMLLGGGLASTKQRIRFEREVELVASLRHPGIVTLYESGLATSGEPYLAMELIDGVTLSDHLALLPERAGRGRAWARPILELFAQVADATAYAHRRGVIHRDLKPGNILVDDEGHPHLLDFGIAKATQKGHDTDIATTIAGEFVGTFRYAAPEQVSGDPDAVDTRTDVYALGVLLYEALTGQRVYELKGSIAQIVGAITEATPTSPSALNPRLDDELDAIVLKALAKEPARRYQSAEALADDLRAYLDNRPVSARGDTTTYVLGKLARRHKTGIVVACAIAALVGGVGAGWIGSVLHANKRLTRVIAVFIETMKATDWRTSGDHLSAEEYVTFQRDRIALEFADDPDLLGPAERALANAAFARDDYAAGRDHLLLALELETRTAPKRGTPEIAAIHHGLGRALWNLREYDRAEHHYKAALDMRRKLLDPGAVETGQTLHHLGATYTRQNRFEEADAAYQEAIAMLTAAGDGAESKIASARDSFASMLFRRADLASSMGDEPQAAAYRDQAHGVCQEVYEWAEARGTDKLPFGLASHSYGVALAEMGKPEEALAHFRAAVAVKEVTLKDNPTTTMSRCRLALSEGDVLASRAASMSSSALWEQAEASYARGESFARQVVAETLADEDDRRLLGKACYARAKALMHLGRADQAYDLLKESLPILAETLGAGHPATRACAMLLDDARASLNSDDASSQTPQG